MFVTFFHELKAAKIPVTLREYLTLMEALQADLAGRRVEDFYYLARAALIKDERHLDRFDQVFAHAFKGLELMSDAAEAQIPQEWLRAVSQLHLTDEEKAKIEALGGWEYINDGPRNLRAVTPEDIQRVAKQYFKPENRSVATYLRKAGTSDEQAELAGLDPNIRQMVVMQLKQIQAATDVEALRQEVNQAESMRGQVPQEYLPAIDYLVKKTRERIAELEAAAAQND